MRKVTALVLSGGGMFGAYQAGVWAALHDTIQLDMVVGASIGSLNGWLIAGGCSGETLEQNWLTLESGSQVACRSQDRGGASNDEQDAPPVPMRCAQRRCRTREICAYLELDRWRQDRQPDEPEPWARSGPRLF